MLSDLRYSLRSLLKSPGFTVVAVLTLALCIGANTAIFSVVHAILLKPYPWRDADRLVYCYNTYPLMRLANAGVSIPDYLDRREGVSAFADAAMYHTQTYNLASTGEPESIVGMRATPSLFSTLQSAAAQSRVFIDTDAQPGTDHVVVLSHALWKNRFGADPAIIGTGIRLTVIGTVVGLFGSYGISRALTALNPSIASSPELAKYDTPLVLLGGVLLLFIAAALACWLPARRATRVNPLEALRAE